MNMLFRSKRFRNNLKKWLIMYIIVMSLMSTVITYSKYITTKTSSDSARVAKFDIKIATNECQVENDTCLKREKYRPTTPLTYEFTVDTSNLEVSTDLALIIYVLKDYEIVKYEEYDSTTEEFVPKELTAGSVLENSDYLIYKNLDHTIINISDVKELKYRLTVKYKTTNNYQESIVNNPKTVMIGYTAIQIK